MIISKEEIGDGSLRMSLMVNLAPPQKMIMLVWQGSPLIWAIPNERFFSWLASLTWHTSESGSGVSLAIFTALSRTNMMKHTTISIWWSIPTYSWKHNSPHICLALCTPPVSLKVGTFHSLTTLTLCCVICPEHIPKKGRWGSPKTIILKLLIWRFPLNFCCCYFKMFDRFDSLSE